MTAADTSGVGASRIRLPAGTWRLLLDFLAERFPGVGRECWLARLTEGKVSDVETGVLAPDAPFVAGRVVCYFRELPVETPIPFEARVLYRDDQLLVADKPHFLPTIPAGRFVRETLLTRLRRDTGLAQLAPLHRLDRGTAGLVLFSVDARTRGAYGALFAERRVTKTYEALAARRDDLAFPLRRRSRIVAGEPFFRQREIADGGAANAETLIDRIEPCGEHARYRLQPLTGRKHQLRVHMAALGLGIVNDDWYPELRVQPDTPDDYGRPLQLLARRLSFVDPLSGRPRVFESHLRLPSP